MKGMKGKMLKKLKSVKPIGYLTHQDRSLQVNIVEGFVDFLPKSFKSHTLFPIKEESRPRRENEMRFEVQEPELVDLAEIMRDVEYDEMELGEEIGNKENIIPQMEANQVAGSKNFKAITNKTEFETCRENPLSENDIAAFRRPELCSSSLFDPNLLAAFQQAVKEHIRFSEAERRARTEQEKLKKHREEAQRIADFKESVVNQGNQTPAKEKRVEEDDPLSAFEDKGLGETHAAVIFYTTTLRGIRKTFEDCNKIRFLLESFRVLFYEKDVSMHMEFKEEMWKILGCKALPPRLFIKGRHIGGAEEVLRLHEQGKFRVLFEGIPVNQSDRACEGCAGFRFIVCSNCNGSHKVIAEDGLSSKCGECNENGLKLCPICSFC